MSTDDLTAKAHAVRFYEGKSPSPWEDLPMHWGQRIMFADSYAKHLDLGQDHESARRAALGEARLWRLMRNGFGYPDQHLDPSEMMPDGTFSLSRFFDLGEKPKEPNAARP